MWRPWRLEWTTAAVAALLGVIYLLLPLMGSDLSAQTARAGFFADHGYTPVDLRWYGGVDQLGYSWFSQPVMALLGVRLTGVLALLVSSVLFAFVLHRTRAPRPWAGALAGTACIAGNLVSGRVTYGLGLVFALAALAALTYPRLVWAAAPAAVLASATSPVAGLFLGLAAAALFLTTLRPAAPRTARIRRWDAVAVGAGAAVPLALSAGLFGDGGWMNISRDDTVKAVVASLAVALLVPRRPLRIGALLSAAGVLAAALVHTPVGLNATRLAVMFTLPLLAAYAAPPNPLRRMRPFPKSTDRAGSPVDHDADEHDAPPPRVHPAEDAAPVAVRVLPAGDNVPAMSRMPAAASTGAASALEGMDAERAVSIAPGSVRPLLPGVHFGGPRWATGLAVLVVLMVGWWWQPPVLIGDVRDMGNPTAGRAYFTPLIERLASESLTGRVEIPPTRDYWEAAYLGDIPLARGWLRQADIDRNPLFFTTVPGATGTGVPLTAAAYGDWLGERAVQFVAVPDTELSWVGRREAELVTSGQPYLTPIWRDAHWSLYAVKDARPIVGPPATMVGQTSAAITFTVPAAADVPVRIHYYPWLRVKGNATIERTGESITIHAHSAGKYTLTS